MHKLKQIILREKGGSKICKESNCQKYKSSNKRNNNYLILYFLRLYFFHLMELLLVISWMPQGHMKPFLSITKFWPDIFASFIPIQIHLAISSKVNTKFYFVPKIHYFFCAQSIFRKQFLEIKDFFPRWKDYIICNVYGRW